MSKIIDAINNTRKDRQRIARAQAEYHLNGAGARWTYGDIYDAYDRPSAAKVRAWEYCKRLAEEYDGRGLRITSRNTFRFSAAFECDDPETGELCYCYITPDYDSFCRA